MKSINKKIVKESLISECTKKENLSIEFSDSLYEEVILRNSAMVYRMAYSLVKKRADADDIYQEVFCATCRKAPYLKVQNTKRHGFCV